MIGLSKKVSSLDQSLSVLHSFFLATVIAFLLEPLVVNIIVDPFLPSSLERFVPLVFFPLRICFYSGIYGALIEMMSGEEMIFTWDAFRENVKRLWKMYALIAALPLALHFLAFVLWPAKNISLAFVSSNFDIILLYLIVSWMIGKKYLSPNQLMKRNVILGYQEAGILLLFYLLQIGLFCFSQMIFIPKLDVLRICLFLSKYIHFLTFLYLAQLILKQYPEVTERFTTGKELILINPVGPGLLEGLASLFIGSYPPAFVVLKALTPQGYRFREFNRVIWRGCYYQSDKLVAITCFTSNCYEAYAIAKEFKKRGSKVILGGPHVTYLPDEALEFCDSVVIGEAEGVWKQVVADYENGTLKKQYLGAAQEDYHEEIHAALLNSPPAVIRDYLETSRGCKFRCHFCTIPSLSDGKVRQKPIFEIVELIEKVRKKYRHVTFIDNNIYNNPAYAKALFEALKPLKIKWSTQCTIDIAKNDEILKLAKESGCSRLLFGYEIFGDSQEKEQRGKLAMADKYIQFTRKIKKMGIQIKAHFIFGHESDRYRDLWSLWKFCFSLQPFFTIVSILTPLPGAALYHDMLKQNRLTNLNWRSYACHALVFRHKNLNSKLMSILYPLLVNFFLFTTSRGGLALLSLCILSFVI